MKLIRNILFILIVLIGGGVGYVLLAESTHQSIEEDDHYGDEGVEEYEIYPGDVAEKIARKENIVLLDVRSLEEYSEIHLENALLIPVQELSQKSLALAGIGEDAKDKEIIIYCRSGARSKIAYNVMKSLGYTNIKSVAGGMIHWEEDAFPFTEKGEYRLISNTQSEAVVDVPHFSVDRLLHDFGIVSQFGGVVETTFVIKNEGEATLSIGELSTSCGCTSAEISRNEILAGEEALLTVYFDPDLHAEPLEEFKRTIFIPTNDPNVLEAEISIKVDINEGV